MSYAPLTGKALRLARLSRSGDGRYLFVPLDHSVADGPVASATGFRELVRSIAAGGADGIVVHKGRLRSVAPDALTRCALIVHLSASTAHATDVHAKVLIGDVEEALRLGADAVSLHVNIGSDTEASQLADLGRVAAACDRWGVPLLAMLYARGPRIVDPTAPALIAHLVNIAADLGADLVKTVFAGTADRMAEVVDSSPLPILAAGGPAAGGSLTALTTEVMAAGCRGLAVGRRVFTSDRPERVVREIGALIHDRDPQTPARSRTEMAGAL